MPKPEPKSTAYSAYCVLTRLKFKGIFFLHGGGEMNIFFASQSFYPYIGGVSTYLLNLAEGLMQRGNDVKVFHLRPQEQPIEAIVRSIRVFRRPKEPITDSLMMGYSNFKERIYRECHGEGHLFGKEPLITYGYDEYHQINQSIGKDIEGLLEEHPTEIVHIHDFQLLLIYRNIQRGIPIILTWHIPFIDSISQHLKEFLIKHMKEFDKVIFSNAEYADSAVRAGLPPDKVEIVYPIANTRIFRPKDYGNSLREMHGIPDDLRIILCPQRIDSKSGHTHLIRAMPKIIEKFPKVKLIFIGSSSMTNKISQEREKYENEVYDLVKSLGLEKSIIFAGNIEYEKMPLYYNAADIIALMSRNEGFGLAITEGMACGKPVIGTNVPGISSQIKDGLNGFIVDVGDTDKTAEKIIELLNDPHLRERMGIEGLRIVKSKFEMTKGIDRHHELYRRLLKEKTDWRLEKIKLSNVSAIVTDFDRTLTDEPGIVDQILLKELKALKRPLILVTGRKMDYSKELYRKYPIWDCIIAENGSCIYFSNTNIILNFTSDRFLEAKDILGKSELPSDYGSSMISVFRKHNARLMELLDGIRNNLTFVEHFNEVMILPLGVNKGSSLRIALNYLKLDPEKLIIVGDGSNDIDLFKNPGFKIAVANASPRLKLLADEITKKASKKGIREIIKKLKVKPLQTYQSPTPAA